MKLCLKQLAELLDGWSDAGGLLTESDTTIFVHALNAEQAKQLVAVLTEGNWKFDLEDGGSNHITAVDLTEDYAPFKVLAHKPADKTGPGIMVTNTGFSNRLRQHPPIGCIRLARCESQFETATLRVAPLDDTVLFEPRPNDASPRRVVRETNETRVVPSDIGPWLLRDVDNMPWADPSFQTWAQQGWINVVRSLANEVDGSGLVFRGPPLVRLTARLDGEPEGEAAFCAIQKAGAWVYDNERELEMRHGLFAAEIARAAGTGGDAIGVIGRLAGPALESARIAYGLNLSQVSRDTLKALADLRKAISDEASKLSDATRSVATSVATAVFAGAGVILARLTTGTPSYALIVLACVPVVYVLAVITSGWHFVKLQRRIRGQWRKRLYVFLPEADYQQMVEEPAKDAESAFRFGAWIGLGISVLVLAGVIWVVLTEHAKVPSIAASSSEPATTVDERGSAPKKLNMTTLTAAPTQSKNGAPDDPVQASITQEQKSTPLASRQNP